MTKRNLLFLLLFILAITLLAAAVSMLRTRADRQVSASLIPADMPVQGTGGFARAAPDGSLVFPADFGPHDEYLTEWWYYTGNLVGEDGRSFGYQLTFFRRALIPPETAAPRDSSWAADQVYLAHFALSDIDREEFYPFERFSRGAAGLAGAQPQPFRVWLYDWSVSETAPGIYHLFASQDGVTLELSLKDRKGPVLQGDKGYSQKGPDPGNASYYFSQTRLESSGTVAVDGVQYPVSGLSWMDHEFSTSALTQDQVGWDWFSIQLDGGAELMLFQIRQSDGSIDPYSSAALVTPDGGTRTFSRDEFEITPTGSWESPHSGAVYPSGWVITIPSIELKLVITPMQSDQELNLTYTYWEGAVGVQGDYQGKPVIGRGYVELTGYAGSFAGEF